MHSLLQNTRLNSVIKDEYIKIHISFFKLIIILGNIFYDYTENKEIRTIKIILRWVFKE